MRCEVIWVNPVFLLDVVLGQGRVLVFGKGSGVDLDLLLGEEFVQGKIGTGGKGLTNFIAKLGPTLFPFLVGLAPLRNLGSASRSFKVFLVALVDQAQHSIHVGLGDSKGFAT